MDREIIRLLLETRQKLQRIYADKSRDPEAMRRGKAGVFEKMRQQYEQWPGDSRYDHALAESWNNARLDSVATYFDLVPGFARLLKKEHGDLKSFHMAVEENEEGGEGRMSRAAAWRLTKRFPARSTDHEPSCRHECRAAVKPR